MSIVDVIEGNLPLILAQPHGGTWVAPDVQQCLNERGRALADTDWHINRLYDGLIDDVTIVSSQVHRYVIDANRGPDDASLYPGQNTTGLCPLTDFDGKPIYQPGRTPDPVQVEQRRARYHEPYHDALAAQIERLRHQHNSIILYDCHSIRSRIPYLFEGVLPDFNIGTYNGASCNRQIEQAVTGICSSAAGYTTIVNGRFKGGWTTRHYGDPDSGVHAIQMELAQSTYMQQSPPWSYLDERAQGMRKILKQVLQALPDCL